MGAIAREERLRAQERLLLLRAAQADQKGFNQVYKQLTKTTTDG